MRPALETAAMLRWVHPNHRASMRKALPLVLALAVGVVLIWLPPLSRLRLGVSGSLTLRLTLEITAIVVAAQVFSVGWASHRRGMPGNILVIACAFLGVAVLDLSHLLSSDGMPDFITHNTPEKALDFWFAARGLAAITLLLVSVTDWRPNISPALRPFALLAVLNLLGFFHWLILAHPDRTLALVVPGHGFTHYKFACEYTLVALNGFAAAVLCHRMRRAQPFNAPALFGAVCTMGLGEQLFTLDAGAPDLVVVVGYLYKAVSYVFLYQAVFIDVIEYPHAQLRASESELKATLDAMPALVFDLDHEGRFLGHHAVHDATITAVANALLGRTIPEIMPEAVARDCMAALADATAQGTSPRRQVPIFLGEGVRWFEVSVSLRPTVPGADARFIMLVVDISSLKVNEASLALQAQRAEALLELPAAEAQDEKAFLQLGVEVAERLTGSRLSFLHFVHEDQETLELVTWSRGTLANDCLADADRHNPISTAGLWADAVRARRAVVHNDYPGVAHKHGLPPSHSPLQRLITVPVLEGGKVRMLVGVGNRPTSYTDLDVESVRLVANDVWRITQQRRAEASLRASEAKLSAILDGVDAHIYIKDTEYRYQYANRQVCEMFGRTLPEMVGREDDLMLPAEVVERLRANDRRVIESGERVAMEEEFGVPGTRSSRSFWSVKIPMRSADGRIEGLCGISTEITDRKRMEQSIGMLSLAVEQSASAIVITDLDARIEYANTAFCHSTGYSLGEVLGKNSSVLQSGRTPRDTYVDMWQHLTEGKVWRGELINRRKDGGEYIEDAMISPVRQADGQITHYLAIKENITEKKSAEARIERLAHFDQLTGLPNRSKLVERFKYAASLAKRRGEGLAVMFLDLDHFKDINDTLGHSLGDQLLMEVARRLNATVRDLDTVSRLGGDEFVLVLPGTDAAGAAHVAARLLAAVGEAYSIDSHELITTLSIGIAMYPDDGADFETLSKNADAAMYRVKQGSRNGFRFFTPEMQEHSARTLRLANALRHALARNEFFLNFQPQFSLGDSRVIGAEALLRWRHPELGMVSPAEFIPIAEDSGQIIQIGEWVLRTAVQQMRRWMDAGFPPMVIAVNLSAAQFRHSNLLQLVMGILAEADLAPTQLELELTEAVAMDDAQAAVAMMDTLAGHGIRMSIDDFGTGYSSLNYLKRFKAYKLKIDQSFVRNVHENPEDKAIVRAIIHMANSLGMLTIAEGVETAEQLDFLRANGCDEVQGYHLSRPLMADVFEAFLRDRVLVRPD